jgi:hypothetical protein
MIHIIVAGFNALLPYSVCKPLFIVLGCSSYHDPVTPASENTEITIVVNLLMYNMM